MASQYLISIPNELSNAQFTGRISKVRPGEGEWTGKVVNVSVVASRRYPEMKDGAQINGADGKPSWKEATSFIDLALWGRAAATFHANPGDVAIAGFSLADMTAHPYTNKDGVAGANIKVTRADFIKVIARKQGGQDAPVNEVAAVGAEAEETISLD